jgi:hypothetical protein
MKAHTENVTKHPDSPPHNPSNYLNNEGVENHGSY